MDYLNTLSADCFRDIFTTLKTHGKLIAPRGQKTIELEHFTYTLPARVRFCNFEARKLKLDYIKREFLWYLDGNAFNTDITKYAKMWESLVNEDGTINSNYGQYIFSGFPSNHTSFRNTSLFYNAVKQLAEDKDSRRAAIPILAQNHLRMKTKDVPCTYALGFRIRENKLNMSVHMRSQDAVFGMGNDAPCFSFIHEMLWAMLTDVYPELELGTYYHTVDSFHVYERHFDVLEKIVAGDVYVPVDCPVMTFDDATLLASRGSELYHSIVHRENFPTRAADGIFKLADISHADLLLNYTQKHQFSNWLSN